MPINEYEALEETAEILSDEDTLAAIHRGLDDLADGDVVPLEQVRNEHARPMNTRASAPLRQPQQRP